MQEFQQGVLAEYSELNSKLNRLVRFIESETYAALPAEEKELLRRQSEIMGEYAAILDKRLDRFE